MCKQTLPQNADARQALFALLPSGIGSIFGMMEIAEAEIARAKELYPRREKEIHTAFGVLCPPAQMQQRPALYRVFAREICERIANGCARDDALDDITDAEMLNALAETSLRVPLNRPGYALYAELFCKYRDILDPREQIDFPTERYDYAGQREELTEVIRRAALKARAR
jgi:hypothetical protein